MAKRLTFKYESDQVVERREQAESMETKLDGLLTRMADYHASGHGDCGRNEKWTGTIEAAAANDTEAAAIVEHMRLFVQDCANAGFPISAVAGHDPDPNAGQGSQQAP